MNREKNWCYTWLTYWTTSLMSHTIRLQKSALDRLWRRNLAWHEEKLYYIFVMQKNINKKFICWKRGTKIRVKHNSNNNNNNNQYDDTFFTFFQFNLTLCDGTERLYGSLIHDPNSSFAFSLRARFFFFSLSIYFFDTQNDVMLYIYFYCSIRAKTSSEWKIIGRKKEEICDESERMRSAGVWS